MSEKIKPAMTAEGWAAWFKGQRTAENDPCYASPHADAAVALYGQPFGFTWEQVDLLRDASDVFRVEWGRGPETDAEADRLTAIADRIAALLPPRKS